MRLGFKLATATALSLAMFSGDLARLSFSPAAAEARSYRHYGGGHYGYRPRYYRHRGGHVGVGDVLAGAVIIGGIAAIASAASRPRDTYLRDGYYDRPIEPGYNYDRYGYPETGGRDDRDYGDAPRGDDRSELAGGPVDVCSRTAEREAQTRDGGFARVTGIERVEERGGGVEVRGTVESSGGDGYEGGRRTTERFICTADTSRVTGFRFVG